MNGCSKCVKAEEAIGRAEVRAAEAEAKLRRERGWWLGWLAIACLCASYSVYLLHSFEIKRWVWYDLIIPARSAQPAQQQVAPTAETGSRRLPAGQLKTPPPPAPPRGSRRK